MSVLSVLCVMLCLAIPAGEGTDSPNLVLVQKGGEMLPDSDVRAYTADEILGLAQRVSPQDVPRFLRLARNEIFARHGYVFRSPDLQAYFGAQPWYRPQDRNVALSPVEQANVATILSLER